ncbi:MAG: hypothetical protein LAO08_05150 [Acidobacteriia bacterium]|nr:hypothetical protein [Terriglobia bacterium]
MRRASASIVFALAAWMSAFAAGCAAPGDPTPRHPLIPAPVADLAARQVGGETVLTFTLPTRSTDGEALAERPSVELYRAALAPGAAVNRKTSWELAYTVPPERVDAYVRNNRFEFHDPLAPATPGGTPGSPLAYKVRTRAVRARASDDSNMVMLRIYPAPMVPGDVRTEVTESAIAIRWSESGASAGATFAGYHVYRAKVESGQPGAAQDASATKFKSSPELLGTPASAEYQDLHFEFGETYVYTVRSVAVFGTDLVESADSVPASVTPRDVFPPAAPVGLEAAVVPATPQGVSYVELSWAISAEPDLAGYRVYRSGREDAAGERLNAELLPSPAFRDMSVMPGERYFYRVSAVDRSGNESPMSFAVPAQVP